MPRTPPGRSTEQAFARLGPVTYRRLDDLSAYARNARRHPERQLVALTASIREFGFNVPVLIDAKDEIIAGHARVEAAKRVGLAEVPTISALHLSPAQVKAYRLADNRLPELAAWDTEALAVEIDEIVELGEIGLDSLGWSTAELDVLTDAFTTEGEADPLDQSLPSVPDDPVSRADDLWSMGRHRLLCGSALEPSSWERLLDGRQARMIFTDPPYNVPVQGHVSGLGKAQHAEFAMASGEMSRSQFTAFLTDFLAAMLPHLADGGVVDVCMDWRHLREVDDALAANELSLLNLCCWNKTNGGMGSLYRSKHELVFIAKKGNAPHVNNVELGKHGRYRTNVWDYAGVNTFGRGRMNDLADHPTVKPVALVADAVRDVTHHGDVVLDAFMGSGTTILAAERSGRTGCGTEIEPRYVDVAIKRWQAMTGFEAVLEATGQSWSEVAAERAAAKTAVDDAVCVEEAQHAAA